HHVAAGGGREGVRGSDRPPEGCAGRGADRWRGGITRPRDGDRGGGRLRGDAPDRQGNASEEGTGRRQRCRTDQPSGPGAHTASVPWWATGGPARSPRPRER